jgi:hypothetical protein
VTSRGVGRPGGKVGTLVASRGGQCPTWRSATPSSGAARARDTAGDPARFTHRRRVCARALALVGGAQEGIVLLLRAGVYLVPDKMEQVDQVTVLLL